MEPTKITTVHIRKVMEGYGEGLPDIGATYSVEFMNWFMQKMPQVYVDWRENCHYIIEGDSNKLIAETLLHEFSNDGLGGWIGDCEHDELLAEFCNQNEAANLHILSLLKERGLI